MSATPSPGARAPTRNWPILRRRRAVGVRLPIWEARAGLVFTFQLIGPTVLAWTHWTGQRTIGCIGRLYNCLWCENQKPRLKAYVGAYAAQDGPLPYQRVGRCVVALTRAAVQALPELGRPYLDLLGRTLSIRREDDRQIGQVLAVLGPDMGNATPMANHVNPRPVLVRLWTEGEDRLPAPQVERMLDLAQQTPVWEG